MLEWTVRYNNSEGAAWLSGRVQHGLVVRVQHGLVISVLGCCTAAPGSNPARHPTLGPAGRKLFAQMHAGVTYPAQEERIPSRRTSRGRIIRPNLLV